MFVAATSISCTWNILIHTTQRVIADANTRMTEQWAGKINAIAFSEKILLLGSP